MFFTYGLCAEVATAVLLSYEFTGSRAYTSWYKKVIQIKKHRKPVAHRYIVLALHAPHTGIFRMPRNDRVAKARVSVNLLQKRVHRNIAETVR